MKQYQPQFLNKYGEWKPVTCAFGRNIVESIQEAKEAIEYHKTKNHPVWRINSTYEYRIAARDVTEWEEV